MKKLSAVILLFALLLTGCVPDMPETPNTMPPSVMIDGVLYQSTGKQIPAEVDPSAISGSIAEVTSNTALPTLDQQSNFGEVGIEYAFTADGLVVLLANEWTLFEPVTE